MRFVVGELPVSVPTHKPPTDKANPRLGVGIMEWSADGRYLATRNDNMPTAVWVWDITRLELASVMLTLEPVRSVAWDPVQPRLATCSGGKRVYVWSPEGASCVQVPLPGFLCSKLAWSPRGSSFLLSDRDTFCCAYIG